MVEVLGAVVGHGHDVGVVVLVVVVEAVEEDAETDPAIHGAVDVACDGALDVLEEQEEIELDEVEFEDG